MAPEGSVYVIKAASTADTADNVVESAIVDLSAEPINGAWKLRVTDVQAGKTGYTAGIL